MPFATPADMLDRFDARTLRDLCSDTGEPATELATNGPMMAALGSASAEILVACSVGNLYSEATLAALEGANRVLLIDMCANLAIAKLAMRRPARADIANGWKQQIEESRQFLDRFRRGERVFSIPETMKASNPTVEGPTTLDIPRLNLLTQRAHGFFPNPALRLRGR